MTGMYRLTVYLDNGMLVVKDCPTPDAARDCILSIRGDGCDDIAVNPSHVVLTTVVGVDPLSKGRTPYDRARLIKGASE